TRKVCRYCVVLVATIPQICRQPCICDECSARHSEDTQFAHTPFKNNPENKKAADEDRKLDSDFPPTREHPESKQECRDNRSSHQAREAYSLRKAHYENKARGSHRVPCCNLG